MLEAYLIKHCAPTLASLKTAGLFRISFSSEEDLLEQFAQWNDMLGKKGVSLRLFQKQEETALIYVYRKSKLEADLRAPGMARFLRRYGYVQTDIGYALSRLGMRLQTKEEFPHEIGAFLGYPLGDVIGFIRNKGQNSKHTGDWKVYCNQGEALRLFRRFKKCKDVYKALWKQGRSILQLTVAA